MVDNIRMDNLNLSEKIMSKILVTSINNHKIQIVVQLIHTLCMQLPQYGCLKKVKLQSFQSFQFILKIDETF